MSKFLILLGVAITVIGLVGPWLAKLGLGRLPGDIVIKREGFSFYLPIVTCILLSLVASAVSWFLRR